MSRPKHVQFIIIALALLLAVLYVLFHLHYMQQFLDWDQIVYANNIITAIEHDRVPLFNSHHVHFESGGKLFHEILNSRTGITDVVFSNRLRSLLTAAVGLFFLLLFLHELTGKILLSVAGTLVAAFSLGYLHYATKVDTPIYPAAMASVILWIYGRLHRSKGKVSGIGYALAGGITIAAGLAAHQYMAIPATVMCACMLLPGTQRSLLPDFRPFAVYPKEYTKPAPNPRRRVFQAAFISAVGIACVFLLFFTIASYHRMTYKPRPEVPLAEDSRSFQRWFWSYATLDSWGYGFKRFNPKAPFTGFTDAFLAPSHGMYVEHFDFRFSYDMKDPLSPPAFSFTMLAIFTWAVIAGSFFLCLPLYARFGRLFPAVLFSFVGLAVFSTYWEPHYFEFWVVPAVFFCVLAVMLGLVVAERISLIAGRLLGRNPGRLAQLAPAFCLLFFAIILFFHNTRDYLVPYSRVKTLRAVSSEWDPSYYNLWSDSVYRHPENVYQEVYGTKPGEIFPEKIENSPLSP